MTQPAAGAKGKIRSLLRRIVEHEVKMNIAVRVDVKYGSSFQSSRVYWQKEIEGLWQQIEKWNQAPSRRRGQFFSDAEISQLKEEQIEGGIRLAVGHFMDDLRQQGIEGDARWLKRIAEEVYD
jgi:hypothetical protein